MLVGVISDTHGVLPLKAAAAMAECDYIIHAGDICDPGILRLLRAYAPVSAVLGNNDYPEYGSDVGRYAHVELDGVRFIVAHYPHDVTPGAHGNSALAPGDPLPDVAIHGHTHIPRIVEGAQAAPSRLLICPGSCSRPRQGNPATVAKIIIERGTVSKAWVERIDDGGEYLSWSPQDSE